MAPPSAVAPGTHGADYWDKVDNMYTDTVQKAVSAFRTNLAFNIIIVAVGIVLIASSLTYSWWKGVDIYSTLFAAIGVADFVLIFFVGPQNYVNDAVNNLTRIQILYRSFLRELEAVSDYDWAQEQKPGRTLDDVKATVAAWEEITERTIKELDTAPSIVPLGAANAGAKPPSPGGKRAAGARPG